MDERAQRLLDALERARQDPERWKVIADALFYYPDELTRDFSSLQACKKESAQS